MKNVVYIIMLMFLISNVYAININAGEQYKVTTLEGCIGGYKVQVETDKPNVTEDYSINKCSFINPYWNCDCINTNNTIILNTLNITTNTFYIKAEYYTEPLAVKDPVRTQEQADVINNNNKRIYSSGKLVVKEGIDYSFPKIEDNTFGIFVAMILVLGLMIGLGIFFYKMFFGKDKKEVEERPDRKKEVVVEDKKVDVDIKKEFDDIFKDL